MRSLSPRWNESSKISITLILFTECTNSVQNKIMYNNNNIPYYSYIEDQHTLLKLNSTKKKKSKMLFYNYSIYTKLLPHFCGFGRIQMLDLRFWNWRRHLSATNAWCHLQNFYQLYIHIYRVIFRIEWLSKLFKNVFKKIYIVLASVAYNMFAKLEINRRYRAGVIMFITYTQIMTKSWVLSLHNEFAK